MLWRVRLASSKVSFSECSILCLDSISWYLIFTSFSCSSKSVFSRVSPRFSWVRSAFAVEICLSCSWSRTITFYLSISAQLRLLEMPLSCPSTIVSSNCFSSSARLAIRNSLSTFTSFFYSLRLESASYSRVWVSLVSKSLCCTSWCLIVFFRWSFSFTRYSFRLVKIFSS